MESMMNRAQNGVIIGPCICGERMQLVRIIHETILANLEFKTMKP